MTSLYVFNSSAVSEMLIQLYVNEPGWTFLCWIESLLVYIEIGALKLKKQKNAS